ncbi:MAG TPA: rRNA maturation RNase YbeY [Burkholderiaceae bacterium]|nr:rRNA maturation RNase YbeY [Burkholderiaceae bacterium]
MPRLGLAVQGRERFAGLPARSTLRRWSLAALDRPAQITLRFVGEAEGRRMNREFRRADHATNVLTFDYEREPLVLADIVLCVPVVRREAREQGKSVRAHLAHLVIHGVLHALGHDHVDARDARRMEALETALLARLRIANPYEPQPTHDRDVSAGRRRASRSKLAQASGRR